VAAGATLCRVRARVARTVVHCSPPRRRQARWQHCQRRWPPPPPAARGCCGKGRDHEDRSAFSAFSANTTPCLKTQTRRLPQGPQSPIPANYRGIAWPFVATSTCPHDLVNAAPALTYLFSHDSASADRTGDEDVATSSNFTERCRQPRRMFRLSRKRWGTSSNGVGSQTDRQKRFLSTPATCNRKRTFFHVWEYPKFRLKSRKIAEMRMKSETEWNQCRWWPEKKQTCSSTSAPTATAPTAHDQTSTSVSLSMPFARPPTLKKTGARDLEENNAYPHQKEIR